MADLITCTRVRRGRWVVALNRVNVVWITRYDRGGTRQNRIPVYQVTGHCEGSYESFWAARRAAVAAIP